MGDKRRGRLAGRAAAVAAVFALVGGGVVAAGAGERPDLRPTAAVALGDSSASGEGARDYEPGTDTAGNRCHRSAHAYIHHVARHLPSPGVDATVNLACSGAQAANLYIDGDHRYGEPSQADQLADVAAEHNVRLVTVQVGANDDPGFGDTVLECVVRWALVVGPGCRDTVGPEWPGRVEAMRPKAAKAMADVRQVMRDAGYADDDYDLIVLSYASPVTEDMRRLTHAAEGCPIRVADAQWGRTVATPLLSDALREVAAEAGARFLDLSAAAEGREACSQAVGGAERWQRALTVRIQDVVNGLGGHVVQESFHLNATGHREIARCLGEFHASAGPEAACRVSPDGTLRAVPPG